jgi:Mrp family chromosome partitioning ATPase/capsular polysaccharide biosynthesis protein
MTFGQYWAIVLKQWKLILACFLVMGVSAYIVSKSMKPIYQSTVLVDVSVRSSNNQADYNSLLASDQLVQTEAQLAVSDPVLREVASHYPGLSEDQLSRQVTSSVKLNTELLEIDVQDPSPTYTAALANDIASTLIKQQLQITQQDNNRSQQQLQQEINTTQQQIDTITTQISTLQAQGGKQPQIAVLQVQLNGLQQHYSEWQTALAQLELAEAQSGDLLHIAQSAQPAMTPVRPQVYLNTAIGFVAGLFLGMVLALLFEQLDVRVRTSDALTNLVGWPILATVRRVDSSKENVINPTGQSANVESYRILRTNIGFSMIDKQLHSILVTSAVPYDGKTTVAANLAIFMAKAGKITLLIDADLRRPTLHKHFHLPEDKMGLSNAVVAFSQMQFLAPMSSTRQASTPFSSNFSLDPFMHSVGMPNLRVIPAGPLPPNPPEFLDSKAMERLFRAIADCGAEVIIFDTPPLLGLSDTSILAPKVDGTLVVVDITHSNKKNLKQMKSVLTQTGSHVLGCVVNKERTRRKDTVYSYYYFNGEQGREERLARNGHAPAAPITPLPLVSPSPFEQRMRSDAINLAPTARTR